MSVDMLLVLCRAWMAKAAPGTRDEIREVANRVRHSLPESVGDGDFERTLRQLESEFAIDLGPAHALRSRDHRPWLEARRHQISFNYWRRYRDLLVGSGFGSKVVNRLDEVTDQILDLSGDPADEGSWSRRGLVVGHVQSGKTANYVGLINKAADAGYRLIILIAGIHSNLRSQTQERIDQGFVGRDSDQLLSRNRNAPFLGVGKINRSFSAVAYTSRAYDFTRSRADGLGISILNLAQPAIFVIKKNKSILTNLIEWLAGTSLAGDRLTLPMLVIDDEADNASVNTARDPDRPNAINKLIRSLLKISTRNSYIGYTATPFANIFIDPDSETELFEQDLFPRNFIVGLDAPTNYVGAQDYFLADEPSGRMTIPLADTDDWLPLSHKIDVAVDDLPGSLVQAIDGFVIAKAIRILRGQSKGHHSMLVNVSRFTGVQGRVASRIREFVERTQQAIENRFALPAAKALRDPTMKRLHDSWTALYESPSETWERIQPLLHQAAAPVKVVEVNASSGPGTLDYRAHADTGLNVIAVGGNSLSRGFTLEGLTMSYFLRNTQMYDTLLQMGRWFGYRDGYKDLCRLYIQPDALDWYAHIAEATEELRREIRRMEHVGLTPMDFGLAVRSHPGSLIVTARNKMRSATQIAREIGLANKLVESSLLYADGKPVARNLELTRELAAALLDSTSQYRSKPLSNRPASSVIVPEVTLAVVSTFIQQFALPPSNPEMTPGPLVEYSQRRGFTHWDVVIASSSDAKAGDIEVFGTTRIGLQSRNASRRGPAGRDVLSISGNKRRVASRGIEAAGLSIDEDAAARQEWKSNPKNAGRSIPDSVFRAHRSRPLLMLHLLKVRVADAEVGVHAAYGISFPDIAPGQVEQKVLYTANLIAFRELYGDADADGDDDDDAVE